MRIAQRLFSLSPQKILLYVAQVVCALSLLLALPSLLIPLGLPPEGDAVDYRIPLLQWMLRHDAYPNWPWSMVDDYPLLAELLMLPFFALSPALARLVPIAAYAGLGFFSGKIFCLFLQKQQTQEEQRSYFWVGAALALSLRPLAIQSNLLMIDNVASFFITGAFYFLLKQKYHEMAVYAALAAATRYTTWPLAFLFCLAPFERGIGLPQFLLFLRLGLILSLGALPFMVRNFLWNDGNPVFPLGTEWAQKVSSDYGRGKGLKELLLFPYDLLYTNSFVQGFYDYTVGKLFYLQLLVGAPFLVFLRKEKRSRQKILALLFISSAFLIWFFGSQQLRFLVPALLIFLLSYLYFLARYAPKFLVILLTGLSLFSALSIQKDSLLLVLGKRQVHALGMYEKARDCFTRAGVPKEAVVAHTFRDETLGFFNRDFLFARGHIYAWPSPENEAPDWVFTAQPKEGYQALPADKPCILKKLDLTK